tara:strand:+ start:15582 stop:15908 length:327 start_codon:yes stop_codon:yes gene_type:complete
MSTLETLEATREKIRAEVKSLTKQITKARREEAIQRKVETRITTRKGVSLDELNDVRRENRRLKGYIAVMEKHNGKTLQQIGEIFNCSASRVANFRELVKMDLTPCKE